MLQVESNLEFGSTTEMLNHSIFDLVESLHSSGSLSSLLRRHFRMALSLVCISLAVAQSSCEFGTLHHFLGGD